MKYRWALLLCVACHDPENEALRGRVAARDREIAKLKAERTETPARECTPCTELERDLLRLECETDLLRKRLAILEKPDVPGTPILGVTGDSCWVLYARPGDLSAGDFKMDRRLTLACYRQDGAGMQLVDVREIAPDLEMIQLRRANGVSVADVLKALKDSKKK